MEFRVSLQSCWWLIRRDMAVFLPSFGNRLINGTLWAAIPIFVFEFIGFGDVTHMGLFIGCAEAICWGFFEVMENVTKLIADLQGERSISYALTLPLPPWMVFVRIALSNTLQALMIAVFILPIAKLLLWNSFSLWKMSWWRAGLIFFLANLFYGFFSVFLASTIKNLETMGDLWIRIVFPLWFLGGYQFTYATFMCKTPFLAYFNLFNPLTYCFEGIRSAVMGPIGFLPFWMSCCALIGFTIVFGFWGIRRMVVRLDCL